MWSFDADAREALAFPDIGRYPEGLQIGLRYRACLLPFGLIAEAGSAEEARNACYLNMLNTLVDAEENGTLDDLLAASGLSRNADGVWRPPPLGGGQAFELLRLDYRAACLIGAVHYAAGALPTQKAGLIILMSFFHPV